MFYANHVAYPMLVRSRTSRYPLPGPDCRLYINEAGYPEQMYTVRGCKCDYPDVITPIFANAESICSPR